MKDYKMWIDGKWVEAESGQTITVVNPATEEEIARIPRGGKADVDKAVAAARKAFPIWSQKSPAERSQLLIKPANAIRENVQELAELDTLDHGSPARSAGFMVMGAASQIEWAANAVPMMMGDIIPSGPEKMLCVKREPVGIAAVIVPWNVPLMAASAKLGPALACGNTYIIKPASIDSLIALKLCEIIEKVGMPPGVVNVVTGPTAALSVRLWQSTRESDWSTLPAAVKQANALCLWPATLLNACSWNSEVKIPSSSWKMLILMERPPGA
jgi:acyl-CoA reductase-like NAD-dependent aldehyde dehydrogenase